MKENNRGVAPVIGATILIAIVVVLAGTAAAFALGMSDETQEPAPTVAEATGEFEPNPSYPDNQIVEITHERGDGILLENIDIKVEATGPGITGGKTEATITNLPGDDSQGFSCCTLGSENINGNGDLIDKSFFGDTIITQESPTESDLVWNEDNKIQFRIPTGEADYRKNSGPAATKLTATLVHSPSKYELIQFTWYAPHI